MIASGPPDVVRADPEVIASYLGHRHAGRAAVRTNRRRRQTCRSAYRRSSMAESDPILEVDSARFAYGDLVAVWDVSFDAAAGTGDGGRGAQRCGQDDAAVRHRRRPAVDRRLVRARGRGPSAACRRGIAPGAGLCLVPEGKRVFRELSVEENIAVAMPRRMRAADRRRRCDEVFDRFPMLASRRRAARRLAQRRPAADAGDRLGGRDATEGAPRRRAVVGPVAARASMTCWPRSTS